MVRYCPCLLVLGLAGCFQSLVISPFGSDGPIEEAVVKEARGFTSDKIAIIDVNGLIMNSRKSGLISDGENPVSLFREKLEHAAKDKDVKAVVVRINSPGGGVTASDIMYRDLLAFRHGSNKPVVACMMDVCASGGYYLAMACDSVYAHPTTVTGSIGVIMNLYNAEGLLTKLGVESDPIKSGPIKDLGNPARKMTDEERAIMQGMVNSMYDRFVVVVSAGRHLPEEQVRTLADGRVYNAQRAKEAGLIDEIGYLEDAIREAKLRAGIQDAKVVAYDRDPGSRGTIYANAPRIPSEINVKLDVPGLNALRTGPAFLYLWEPGAGME